MKRLFGDLGVTTPLQSFNPPIQSEYAGHARQFEKYVLNLNKVNQLMTGDGWTKNGSGIWAKNGKTASFTINSHDRTTSAVS